MEACALQLLVPDYVAGFRLGQVNLLIFSKSFNVCYISLRNKDTHTHTHTYIYIYIYIYISCRAASTDIPDPLSPLLPIVHRFWQVFWATSRILTELLYSCMFKLPSCHMRGFIGVHYLWARLCFSSSVLHVSQSNLDGFRDGR